VEGQTTGRQDAMRAVEQSINQLFPHHGGLLCCFRLRTSPFVMATAAAPMDCEATARTKRGEGTTMARTSCEELKAMTEQRMEFGRQRGTCPSS
jgi:hypothetical protein